MRETRFSTSLGSTSISGANAPQIPKLIDALATAHARGAEVILVSSGAIATGLPYLKLVGRPTDLATIAGKSYTITGVMPAGWKFPIQNERVDYIAPLLPLFASENYIERRGAHFLLVVGRLKPGVDLKTATADLQTIALANTPTERIQRAGATARGRH